MPFISGSLRNPLHPSPVRYCKVIPAKANHEASQVTPWPSGRRTKKSIVAINAVVLSTAHEYGKF